MTINIKTTFIINTLSYTITNKYYIFSIPNNNTYLKN